MNHNRSYLSAGAVRAECLRPSDRSLGVLILGSSILLLFCNAPASPSPAVEPDSVSVVHVTPEFASVKVGDTALLTARVLSHANAEISPDVAWSVRDPLIVHPITSSALQVSTRAEKPGSTWVVAQVSSKRDSTRLVVQDSARAPGPGSVACDTSRSGLRFLGNFEQPSPFSDWELEEASSRSWSHTAATLSRECKGSVRLELRKSDPEVAGSFRSEIKLNSDTLGNGGVPTPDGMTPIGQLGSEVWWGWSVYIPSDWIFEKEYAPETLMQVSQTGRSPAFSVGIDGDEFVTETRYGHGRQEEATIITLVTSRTPVVRGVWTDWVVHAKWSGEGDGVLEVWKNGTQIVNRAGPTAYSDWTPRPYPKWGIYKWSWKGTGSIVTARSLYIDAVRITDGEHGSYAQVAPR